MWPVLLSELKLPLLMTGMDMHYIVVSALHTIIEYLEFCLTKAKPSIALRGAFVIKLSHKEDT